MTLWTDSLTLIYLRHTVNTPHSKLAQLQDETMGSHYVDVCMSIISQLSNVEQLALIFLILS